MPSDPQMAEFVCEMLQGLGEPRVRRMFTEYCIYLKDKPVGFVVNNTLLVKTNEEMRKERPELPTQKLFEEAVNPMWVIEDPDDRKTVRELYQMARDCLPAKRAKKSSSNRARKRINHKDGEGSPLRDPVVMGKSVLKD